MTKYTKTERLTLINQFKILSVIDQDNEARYGELITILENGYSVFYNEVCGWISEDMSDEDCKLVLETLSMYRAIEGYKTKNGEKDFTDFRYGFFNGFDGNNETSKLSFSRFLLHDQGKFGEQKKYLHLNDDMNSHAETTDTYNSMLHEWNKAHKKYDLTREELLKILEASMKR